MPLRRWSVPTLVALVTSLSACSHEPLPAGFEASVSPLEWCVKSGVLTLVTQGPGDRTALVFRAPEPKPPSTPATVKYEFTGGLTSYTLTAQNGDHLVTGLCAGTSSAQVFESWSGSAGQVEVVVHTATDATAYELQTVGVTLHLDNGGDTRALSDLALSFPRSAGK